MAYKTAAQKRRLTIVAALLAMVGPFSIDTYLPSFPDMELVFAVKRAVMLQSIGVYLTAFAVATLFWGPLSDRIGRRKVILISVVIYLVASLGCALADNFQFFLLMRVLQGVSASGGFTAGRTMIRDVHKPREAQKAMSQVMLLFALAPAVAPVLGGWLHSHFGWRSVFWFLSLFALVLLLLISNIKETLIHEHRQSFHPLAVLGVYKKIILNRVFMRLVFCFAFSFAGLFVYIAGAPTVIYDFLGLGSEDFSLQFIPMVSGMMLGNVFSMYLANRLEIGQTIKTGFGVMLFAVALNLFQVAFLSASVWTVITPLVVFAFGLSLAIPGISILALDCFPKNRGAAASVQGFTQTMMNAGVASLVVPFIHKKALYFVSGQALFLLLAMILWAGMAAGLREGVYE